MPKANAREIILGTIRTLRYDLLWFAPVFIWIFQYIVLQNVVAGYGTSRYIIDKLGMETVMSPSAYMYFLSLFAAILAPVMIYSRIPGLFEETSRHYRRRYLLAFGLIASIWISAVAFQFVLWGSFPVIKDRQGQLRIRMVPFLPWPETPFFRSQNH
jgi:hypothetical protein